MYATDWIFYYCKMYLVKQKMEADLGIIRDFNAFSVKFFDVWLSLSLHTMNIFYRKRASISLSMSHVWKLLEKRFIGLPFWSIRNFSKFQLMSDLFTGFQIINFGSPIKLSVSSLGIGSLTFSQLNTGCSPSPFTITCKETR